MFRQTVLLIVVLVLLAQPLPVRAGSPETSLPVWPVSAPSRKAAFGPEPEPPARFSLAFDDPNLRLGMERVGYVAGTCDYLRRRLDLSRSEPGTIVLPVMFHGIFETVPEDSLLGKNMSAADFAAIMNLTHNLGFQTISTAQLIDFLYNNGKIPPRSLYLIFDDRFPDSLEQYALPKLQEFGWTAVLAWIPADTTEKLWSRVSALVATGHFEVQSHGFRHWYMKDDTPHDIVENELYGPQDVYKERFGIRPLAHVWPGGHFTAKSVEMAEEAGYRLGFTVYPRGPLMFNSIPLGEEEMAVSNPLLVLPRYWPTFGVGEFEAKLNRALQTAEAARVFAEANRDAEMSYLVSQCGGIPSGVIASALRAEEGISLRAR
jgi:peptidoglycan/xylan/chitin deacetylase (PgdA/CDA1 family)